MLRLYTCRRFYLHGESLLETEGRSGTQAVALGTPQPRTERDSAGAAAAQQRAAAAAQAVVTLYAAFIFRATPPSSKSSAKRRAWRPGAAALPAAGTERPLPLSLCPCSHTASHSTASHTASLSVRGRATIRTKHAHTVLNTHTDPLVPSLPCLVRIVPGKLCPCASARACACRHSRTALAPPRCVPCCHCFVARESALWMPLVNANLSHARPRGSAARMENALGGLVHKVEKQCTFLKL